MKLITNTVKGCFALLLFNMYVFTSVFHFSIPHCTQITSLGAVTLIILYSIISKGDALNAIFHSVDHMFIYFAYITSTGLILAAFIGYNINYASAYFEKIIIAIIVSYIIYKDKSIEFINLIGMMIAAFISVYAITHLGSLDVRLRLTEGISENSTGILLIFGIISTFLTDRVVFNRYVKLALNALYIVALVLTASRQALLLAIIVYLGWFISSRVREGGKGLKVSDFVFLTVCVIGIVYIFNSGILDAFEQTNLYARLTGHSRSTTISDQTRFYLYQVGVDSFLNSPFIGVGFNNLPSYTHITYLEVLGGTGFFGMLIFYYPYLRVFILSCKRIRSAKDLNEKNRYIKKITVIILILVMMLFRAVHYYIIPIVIIASLFFEDGSIKYPYTHRSNFAISIRGR